MLLGQMGTILRSGIGAVRMLEELSHRQSLKPKARKAMEEMSRFVTSGGSLSDAMSGFPEIFPDGVVGATRAGEAGGYLPDALSNASAQIQESWKLRRYYLWTGFAVFNTVVLVPFLPVMRRAAEGLGATLNNGQGAEQDFVGVYLEAWKQGMMGPPLVMIFLICALFLFGPYLFGRIWFLPIRHLLSAKLPLVGWRSRLESGRELSFHLERLAIAGISPYRSYQLAAGAVPNKYYRDRLVWAGDGLREDQSYVNVLAGGVLPQDMVDLVRTGELTGTTPQAFDQIQRMVEGEKRILDNVLKFKAIVWVAIFGLGISSIVAALMMRDFYDVMWKAIFEGTGW
jgi:type II secretory pathway component PulF